jgi:transmembrane 9 superfamily protein 2/4
VVDGLPAAHLSNDERTNEEYYSIGFALGANKATGPELNNHYEITVEYHHREDGKYRVVGVLVSPISRAQTVNEKGVPVPTGGPLILKGGEKVVYSYSVEWKVSYLVKHEALKFIRFVGIFKALGYSLG